MIMDLTAKSGQFWYSAEHISEMQEMLAYLRSVYEYIKDIQDYRPVKHVIALRNDNFDQICKIFPQLEPFRIKYGLHKRILCLEYTNRKNYLDLPHDHDDIESSIFFPLCYSDHAGTAFFQPKPEELIEVPQLKLGKELGDTLKKPRYSCSIDHSPAEIAVGNRPMVFRTDTLHCAYETEIGHPDNYTRVTLAWESLMTFEQMIAALR
jgi:hypothetical protein